MPGMSVGAISVSMGIDLAEYDSGLKKAADDAATHIGRMSAGLKQSSREGAEALRLVDEAIGIHLSRPLTNILARIPGVGDALKSLLGVGVFGALTVAGVEFGEKIARSLEKAAKAQEEFQKANVKVKDTFDEIMGSYAQAEKMQSMSHLGGELFKIDIATVTKGREEIDKLAGALEDAAAKAEAASGWFTKMEAAIDSWGHQTFSFQSTLDVEGTNKQFQETMTEFNRLSQIDLLKGTHESADLIKNALANAQDDVDMMTAQNKDAARKGVQTGTGLFDNPYGQFTPPNPDKVIDARKGQADGLKKILEVLEAIAALDAAEKNEQLARAIEEASHAANEHADSLTKMLKAAMPAKDEIIQLDEAFRKEMSGLRELVFLEGPADAAKRLGMTLADAAKAMRDLNVQKESSHQLDQFLQHGVPGAKPPALPDLSTPTTGAQYGGLDGAGLASARAQFDKFKTDLVAQNKLIADSFTESIPPEIKHQLALQEIAFTFGRLAPEIRNTAAAQAAYQAAVKQADDAMVAAADHVHKMQEEMEKLLERSSSAADGLRAFALQVQISGAENGKFAFSFATQAFKDFEDGIAKTITATANQQGQLRQMWQNYFKSLEEMAVKFSMDKVFASVLQQTGLGAQQKPGTVPAGGPAGESAPSGSTTGGGFLHSVLGKAGGLIGEIFGIKPQSTPSAAGPGQAASSGLEAAATQLKLAATQLQSAAQALQGSAAGLGGGASGGGNGFSWSTLFEALIPHESGGDATPGQGYLVGEKGPEAFFPKAAGMVQPHSALFGGGGETHIHNYDLRGADPAAVARLERALPMIEDRAVARAQSMQKESGLRKRPG